MARNYSEYLSPESFVAFNNIRFGVDGSFFSTPESLPEFVVERKTLEVGKVGRSLGAFFRLVGRRSADVVSNSPATAMEM